MGTGNYLDMLLAGLGLTIKTSVLAWIIALAFGIVVGVLRTLPSRTASWIGFAYVEFFRNMPLLVQLFLWFFVLPELLPRSAGLWLKQLPNAPFWTAAIGVGLFMSARVAVQLAAGVGSLPRGQRSEEHTSELQSHVNLVCRLLLEKKKQTAAHCPWKH